ncbi:MAG: signal recognition particle protein, partial [Firmicutes bacterium]|nr:signal recognition particle protein [Bacillota bacterium]
ENAQESFDKENVERLAQKFNRNKFDLEDFLLVLNQIKKMGPLKSIMSCLPIMDKIPGVRNLNDVNFDDKIVTKIESVILSMTFAERAHPEIIDFSRKKRISKGSGSKLEDINNLLKRFGEMKKMMKQFDNKGGLFGMNKFNFLSKFKKR